MRLFVIIVLIFLLVCFLAVIGFVLFDSMPYNPAWDEPLEIEPVGEDNQDGNA